MGCASCRGRNGAGEWSGNAVNVLSARAASAIANQPLLLDASSIYRAIATMQSLDMQAAATAMYSENGKRDPGYDEISGVAVIPIRGILVQRLNSVRPYGDWATGYDGIRNALLNAVSDSAIRAIAFDINSPGGTTAGAFDLADTVRSARGSGKPMWSILSESAYSAAYLLAAQTDRITVPRTGGAGSIGVVAVLFDVSEMLTREGIKPIIMHFGKHKADLTKAQLTGAKPALLDELQQNIDMLGEMFVDAVATGRGMSPDDVRATEARCYTAQDAVSVGLADIVQRPDQAMRALIEEISG